MSGEDDDPFDCYFLERAAGDLLLNSSLKIDDIAELDDCQLLLAAASSERLRRAIESGRPAHSRVGNDLIDRRPVESLEQMEHRVKELGKALFGLSDEQAEAEWQRQKADWTARQERENDGGTR